MKNLIIGRNRSNKAKLASYFLSGKNYSEMIVQVPEILLLIIIDNFPLKNLCASQKKHVVKTETEKM